MSLFVAIQDPIIQNFAIRIFGGYVSSKTGADVKIGKLYIQPDFTIHIEDFLLKDLKDNELLNVKELVVRPLMQDIINGNINIDHVKLNNANASLITYEGEEKMNLQFLVDFFNSDKEKEKKEQTIPININSISVNGLDFQYWNQNKDTLAAENLMNYAHIVVNDIQLDVKDLNIHGDSITAVINRLAAQEQSGFTINHLESQVCVSSKGILLDGLNLKTDNSQLDLDLHMLYPGYHAFANFVDSVNFDNQIRQSTLLLSDLGPFSKALHDMPNRIKMEGMMKGPIQSFELDKLKVRIGEKTRFEGNLSLEPIDFLNGNHSINIKKLNYSYQDLSKFRIPGPSKTIPLPDMLKSLGEGSITGSFSGSIENFIADLNVTSEIGDVNADIRKHRNEWNYDVIEGYIEALDFDVGTLANASKTIGTINLEADVICRIGQNNDIDLDIDGYAHDAILLGNDVNEISLNGNLHKKQFNGILSINDEDLGLDFKGRFDFSNPQSLGGDFTANITNANLHKLNIIKDDPAAALTASITADMTSINNFNEAEGNLIVNGFTFKNHNGTLKMDELDAKITNDKLLQKKIILNSDYLDFTMAGKMDLTTLGIAFKQYVNNYVKIPQWEDELEAFAQSEKSSDQDFMVNLNIKDPKPLTRMFIPNLTIADNTYLNGTFTSRSKMLNLTMRSQFLKYNSIKINNIECRSQSSPRRSITRLNLDNIILRDSTEANPSAIGLDNFSIVANLRNDSILTDISWNDAEVIDHNKADIRTSFIPLPTGGRFNVYDANILLNDTLWGINPKNYVMIDSSRIQLSNVELVSSNQSIKFDGYVPNTVNDTLFASFNQFNLSTLNFILGGKGMYLSGRLYGKAEVSNLKENPTLLANLAIKQLGINKEIFGDADISSRWDNVQESINLNVGLINNSHKSIDLVGAFYPLKKSDNLDFQLNLDSLNIALLNPFASGIAERIQGYGEGGLTLKGDFNKPQIDGTLKIKDGGCKIDFLNTFYSFSPTIRINDSLISILDLSLTDTLGNTAMVTGQITHDHLKDFYLSLRMFPSNFLAMATGPTNNPSFYGTAIASGIIEAKGPFNDLDLKIKARTRKGTVMTIPIGGKTGVKTHDFIVFVDKNAPPPTESEEELAEEPTTKKANFNIGLDLNVDKDAQIKIALPNNLGTMDAKGDGNIKLGVNSNDLSLIGEYVISEGYLSLNIQDLVKRNFSLDPGSSISWTGDPVNGTINAIGVYQTKASVASLGIGDSTNMSNNVKVECLVRLKNKLMNPDISFGIRLPNASEDMQQAVFSVIDTTNQSDVFTQTLFLLAFNSFNYGEGLDGYGLLSGQLSDFVSKFTNDFDINFNYKPGSEMANEEMTVAMKKQLFDDRLSIETNFGVIIPSNNYANNSTTIVGDVNVDYKITKDGRFSAQVFNRSNYNTIYYQYTYYKMAPYTQGIGLSYNKSFDKFRDIFKKQSPLSRPTRPLSDRTTIQNQNPRQDNDPTN